MFRLRLACLVSALCLGTTTGVTAQDPDSVVALDPVLVRVVPSATGTQNPYPVSVVAGEELRRATASAFIDDAVRAVPGVQIHNRFNFAVGERIAVRGFGPRSQFGVRGIRVLVDGIPATLPDGQATLDHLDLAGLDRVEVLRGPNSALYGNAAGGVLHFRTFLPDAEGRRVTLRTTGGSHGLWSFEGNASGVAGEVGYRVGFTRMNFDGYRRDPVLDDGTPYGAADRSTLNATVRMPLASGALRVVANGMDLDAENPGSLPESVLDEGDRAAWGFNVRSGAFKDVRQGQLGAAWTGSLGATTAEVASWGVRRELFNPIPGRVIDLTRNAGGVRTLVQGRADVQDATTLGWGAGVEAEFQSDARQNFGNDGGEPTELILDQQERVRGIGLFAQGRLETGGPISVLAGLRYDRVSFAVDDLFTGGGDPDDTGERAMSAVSPSAGIVVSTGSHTELFGSVGRSFETPTTTELANRPSGAGGFNPGLEPQIGTTWEGGARARLAGTVALEGSIFRTTVEDGLVPFEVPSDPGRTYFRNAARTRHIGFELSAEAQITHGVRTRLAYTNVDAEYLLYETDDDVFSGNAVPGLAPQRLDALLIFDHEVGFLEARVLWQDDVPVDDENSASSPSHTIADIRIGASDIAAGRVALRPFIAIGNLFDATYNSSVVPNAFGSRFFEPGPARSFRLGLGVTWM